MCFGVYNDGSFTHICQSCSEDLETAESLSHLKWWSNGKCLSLHSLCSFVAFVSLAGNHSDSH